MAAKIDRRIAVVHKCRLPGSPAKRFQPVGTGAAEGIENYPGKAEVNKNLKELYDMRSSLVDKGLVKTPEPSQEQEEIEET